MSTFADSIQVPIAIAADHVHVCSLTLRRVKAPRVWLDGYGRRRGGRSHGALTIVLVKAHVTLTESVFTMGIERTPVVALIVVVVVVVISVVVQSSSQHSVHQVSVVNTNHGGCSSCSKV